MVDAETVSTRATFSWKFAIGNRNTGYSRYSLKALSWLAGGCIVDSKIFIRFLPCCSSMFKLSKLSKLCTLSTFQEVSQHRCWDPSVGRPALKKTEERRKMKEKRKNGRKKKRRKHDPERKFATGSPGLEDSYASVRSRRPRGTGWHRQAFPVDMFQQFQVSNYQLPR